MMGAELSLEDSCQGSYDLTDNACNDANPEEKALGEKTQATAPQSGEQNTTSAFMDKFQAKMKQESMYELRKLKHNQRPVSSFTDKQALEKLYCETSASGTQTSESSGSVANRAKLLAAPTQSDPQSLMPEGVRIEIRGLVECRPVHEILNGPVHDEIEQALREGPDRRSRRQHRRRARASPPLPRPAAQHDHGRPRASRAQCQRSSHQRRVQFAVERPRPVDGRYPVRQRDQSEIMSSLRQSPALNSLDPEARNEIFAEVSNLVQQQLVSSALSGEFRGVLELHIQERADRANRGEDGRDFLQSLQRRSHYNPRNSVQSEPSDGGASFSELQQDLQDMRAQVVELKQMMKVSFDLQLDIQRSIRQEVAAALAAFSNPAASAAPASPILSGAHNAVSSGNCIICSEASIDCVVYRCGHMCVCMACGLELQGQGLKCPICRAPITEVIRAYTSML